MNEVEVVDLTDDIQSAIPSGSSGATPRLLDVPFHLLSVRGIPEWANEGFLGFQFSKVVRGPISWALISNYMLDFRWLLSACPELQQVPRVVIVHGESGSRAAAIHREIAAAGMSGRVFTHSPLLPPYGTHHSKAFFLKYPKGLRVIIHTANAIYCDINNKSQAVYLQDFPLKDDLSPASSTFEEDLHRYVAALKLPPNLAKETLKIVAMHDFAPARVHLIASVPSSPAQCSGGGDVGAHTGTGVGAGC